MDTIAERHVSSDGPTKLWSHGLKIWHQRKGKSENYRKLISKVLFFFFLLCLCLVGQNMWKSKVAMEKFYFHFPGHKKNFIP